MKFLLLTNNDNDGVGQHAARLNDEFISLGHQSKTLVLHKTTKNKNIIKIERSILKKIFYFTLNFLKKQSDKLFSFGFAGIGFNVIKSYIHKADIIIIYSFLNALSIDDIEKLLNTKKIIYFRALDMELASGGCHVNFDYLGNECKKYEANCSTCPQLNFLNIFNLSKKIILKKKKYLKNTNLEC